MEKRDLEVSQVLAESAKTGKSYWNKQVMLVKKPEDAAEDVGPAVVDFIRSSMMVDEQWSVNAPRGFTWWGHRLAQRIWADECLRSEGVDVTVVHVETDFLRNVEDSREAREGINSLNAGTGQWAFVYYPKERKVKLHTAFCTHYQVVDWTKRLLMGAAGLQASYAHKKARACRRLFKGAEPDISPHPENGYRKEKDEIVLILDTFLERSRYVPGIDGGEFQLVEKWLPKLLSTYDEKGVTVEVPFSGDEPAIISVGRGLAPVTALLRANSVEKHPVLGRGLAVRMTLPVSFGRDNGMEVAGKLNLRETREFTKGHLNGAWSINDKTDVVFTSFLPVAFYQPRMLVNFVRSCALRSRWADEVLNK